MGPCPTPVTLNRPDSVCPITTRTAAEASSPPATVGLATTSELLADGTRAGLERVTEPRGVLPAAGGAVLRSAPGAADDRRELLHQIPRVNAPGEVLAHGDREAGPARVRRTEHRHPGPEPVTDAVREATQHLLVVIADVLHHELRAIQGLGLRHEAAGHLVDAALLERRELLLEAFAGLL